MKTDIKKYDPCKKAVKWFNTQESNEKAWKTCHRGDWMLWIANRLCVDEKKLTLAADLCANTVRHLMYDERSTNAVDSSIAYGRGEISKDELKDAADASYNASYAAYYAADAIKQNMIETANICRDILTDDIFKIVGK